MDWTSSSGSRAGGKLAWWAAGVLLVGLLCAGLTWGAAETAQWVLERRLHTLGRALDDLRLREWLRTWSTPGLASRQAAWNSVKAAYVLDRNRPLDPKTLPTPQRLRTLTDALRRLSRAEDESRHGCPDMIEEGGSRLRAYVSEIDGSLQTYSLSLPAAYDPAVKWPLIISLHGHGWFRPFQGHPAPRYAGMFCLSPQGRGATDYMALGENDVLRALQEVEMDYNIDPNRIYVTGGSMGGTGSWQLGVHYADRFAGITPISGNADYRAWTYRWGWNQPFPGRFDALREYLQERHTPRAYAGNLLHLPTYCIHGSADTIVPPQHARNMVAALRAAGCPVEYREFPKRGHGGFPGPCVDEGRAWMCAQVRDAYPRHVRWKASLLRRGKAYWVRIEQFLRACEFMEIEAWALDRRHVRVRTRNIRQFRIERTPRLFESDAPLFVDVDGERVIFPPIRGGRRWAALVRTPQRGWLDASQAPPAAGPVKRPGFEGPISEVLQRPFTLVLGTMSVNPEVRRLWQEEALSFVREWKRRNNAPCPVVRDVECDYAMMRDRDLILLGGSRDNAVAAALADGLPFDRLAAKLPLSASGPPRNAESAICSSPDRGLFLLYPNPLAPERLVVLVDAGGPEAIYQAWKRFGNWFNWGVFDSKKYFDFAVYDAVTASPESFLALGWFGPDWDLKGGVWKNGSELVRADRAPQLLPRWTEPPVGVDRLDLVDLRPTRIDQMRGAVGFGRTFYGRPLPGGLGVRAPSYIEYDLGGRFDRFHAKGILLNEPESAQCKARFEGERLGFIVKGDGRVLARAEGVTLDAPEAVLDADVTGVSTLRLEVVVKGGPAWLHGSAAWTEGRLERSAGNLD